MAKRNLPSKTDILQAIYAAVHHEDQTRSSLYKNPNEKALHAFYTPIKVFLELPSTCEVEARFGSFHRKGFTPGVPQNTFKKVQTEVANMVHQEVPVVSKTLIEIKKGVRKIINLNAQTYKFQRKTSFRNDYVDLKDLGVRIGASLEENVSAADYDTKSSPEMSRTRLRSTYRPWKGLKIDFTEVEEKGSWESYSRKKYEIEIERVSECAPDVFIDAISTVAEWIRQTPSDSLNPSEKTRVIQAFNLLFNDQSSSKFVNYFVDRPISIKYKNLFAVIPDDSYWDTTIKVDGVRKFLFITFFGSFLCDPFSNRLAKVGQGCTKLNGTLIDGEYLEEESKVPSFHAFDLLFHKTDQVRRFIFTDRKRIFQSPNFIKKVVSCLDSSVLSFCFKKFYSSKNFYANVRNALEDTPGYHTRNIKTDGLIFQPTRKSYSHFDIWKWKPPDLLSIDFYFSPSLHGSGDSYALLVGGAGHKRILFEGDRVLPYTPQDVIVKDGRLGGVSVDNKVVECFYQHDRFVPFRVRPDKPFPNANKTAQSVWRDIKNPISRDTIKGYSLKLFRLVSNTQKQSMLNTYIPQGQTILDIGSGRGGDLQKWARNQYSVYAVEPDKKHREEFRRRLQNMTPRKRHVTLIDTVIEDTEAISKVVGSTPIDAVVAFFSLTYISKNKQTWSHFLRSLDRFVPTGGVFVGTVLDGLKTRQLLAKNQGALTNPTFEIKRQYQSESPSFLGDEIFLDIKDADSLVKTQTEYLFYFDFFQKSLTQLGFTLVKTDFFSDLQAHRNLPSDSKLYSTLMRSFVFKRNKSCVDPFIDKISRCLASLFTEEPLDIKPEEPLDIKPEEPLDIKPEEPLDIKPEGPLDIKPEEKSGEAPPPELFPCPECSRIFQRKSSLTKHLQKHTQEGKSSSPFAYRYALTFSADVNKGFSCPDLEDAASQLNAADPGRATVVNITVPLAKPDNYQALIDSLRKRYKKKRHPFAPPLIKDLPQACLLVIKNGISLLMEDDADAAKLYPEQDRLRYDGKFFDKGKLKVKRAHKAMIFSAEGRKASDDYKQPTVTAFSEVPRLTHIRSALSTLLGPRTTDLEVDGTKYHTSFHEKGDDGKLMKKKSNTGWHGDDKRKIVVGVCLGAAATLSFVWRLPGSSKNFHDTLVTIPLHHGDIYVMSEKATGFDWKLTSLLRVLHSIDLN